MDTVKILIHNIEADISDEDISRQLKVRLYESGVLTHGPISIKREEGTLIVTLGVFGTIDLTKMADCVDRYLKDDGKPGIISNSGSDVVLR